MLTKNLNQSARIKSTVRLQTAAEIAAKEKEAAADASKEEEENQEEEEQSPAVEEVKDEVAFMTAVDAEKENSEEGEPADQDQNDANEDAKSQQESLDSVDLDIYKIYSDGEPADPVALTEPGFVDIARIEAGGSFGALSLIQGKKRMGTTKALTRCHLLALSKTDWKQCEKEITERKISDRVTFIKNIPLFGKLSHTFLT